ncbi:MAG: group II intron maturase-specific domain-containing protein [Luteolibacter sp.]
MVPLNEASFLGFRIQRKKIRWTDKSQKKLKEKVRAITKRTRGVSPGKVMVDLSQYLCGAINYYACGIPYREILGLDQWMRRRVRLYHWKQWGRPRTRRRKLISLGIDRDEVHMASRSRKGHWRMSRNSIVHRAMTDAWLKEQGVPNLNERWIAIRYPGGPKGQLATA